MIGIAFVIGTFLNHYDSICMIQGVMVQFATLSMTMWSFCIAFTLLEGTVFSRNLLDVRQCEPYFHFISWVVPIVSAGVAYHFDLYGKAGGWCWIDDYESSERFLYFYLELIVVFVYSIVAQIFVVKYFRKRIRRGFFNDTSTPDSLASAVSLKLRLFILAFLCSYFVAMIHRILDLFFILSPFWLVVIHTCTVGLSGFFNFAAYFISTRGRVLDWITPILVCLRRAKRKELTTSTIGSVQSPDAQNVREAIRSLSLYPQYYQRQRDFESDDEESEKESEKIVQPPPSSYGTLASVGANIQDNVNKKCCSINNS